MHILDKGGCGNKAPDLTEIQEQLINQRSENTTFFLSEKKPSNCM